MSNDNIKIVIETNKEGLTLKDINQVRENFNSLSDEDFINILEGAQTSFRRNETIVKFMRLPIGSKIVEE